MKILLICIVFGCLKIFNGVLADEVILAKSVMNDSLIDDVGKDDALIEEDFFLNEKAQAVKIENELLKEADGEDEEKVATLVASKYLLDGVAMPGKTKSPKGNIYILEDVDDLKLTNNYFDIPVVYNKRVKKWINYYTNKGRKFFELHIERAGRYAPLIGSILEKNGLPRDLIFLAMAESGFNNYAKSSAAAVGPGQFMPATGKMYNLNQSWYVDERKDPVKATIAAANYLAKLYNDFGSWKIAMAAYNAGEGKLGRAIKIYKTKDFWDISKGNYLKSETRNYVPKIMALAIIGKNLKAFGFHDIDLSAPLDFDEVNVLGGTNLYTISKELNVSFSDIQKLNPELLRWFTPLNIKNYKLRLPPGVANEFKVCCSKIDFTANDFQRFTVRKNKMSLVQVSNKFRIKNTYVLEHLNGVDSNYYFKKGTEVILPFMVGHKVSSSAGFYTDLFQHSKPKKNKKKKIHVIKKGDSLYSISKKYNLSIRRLLAINNRNYSRMLFAGERLVIR